MGATHGGLLIRGTVVPIEGYTIWNPLNAPWAKLDPRDYRMRRPGEFFHQTIIHTTKGTWPQYVRSGKGPGMKDKLVADYWRGSLKQSAAQIVVDNDGDSAACLCDLATTVAYHATYGNAHGIGIEMYQEADGGIFEPVLELTVAIVLALADQFGFPLVMPKLPYQNKPLQRLIHGGPDFYGVYGHRDNTSDRGRGDPGDEITYRLVAVGAECFDLEQREDVAVAKRRQGYLNATHGAKLVVDGKPGASTMAAARSAGFKMWRDVPA